LKTGGDYAASALTVSRSSRPRHTWLPERCFGSPPRRTAGHGRPTYLCLPHDRHPPSSSSTSFSATKIHRHRPHERNLRRAGGGHCLICGGSATARLPATASSPSHKTETWMWAIKWRVECV
jgi:hypothetical protein